MLEQVHSEETTEMPRNWQRWLIVTAGLLVLTMVWVEFKLWTWKPGGSGLFDVPGELFVTLIVCSVMWTPVFYIHLFDGRRMKRVKVICSMALFILMMWAPLRIFMWILGCKLKE